MNNLKQSLLNRLELIANAERVTKVELAGFAREALIYVPASNDIDLVNRLIEVLTPMNKAAAIRFFSHFLPWEQEKDAEGNHVRFGKKLKKEKMIKQREEAIKEFLEEEENNFWKWQPARPVKKKDFFSTIRKDVEKALAGDERTDTPPLPVDLIIRAVMEGGISFEQMLDAATQPEQEEQKQAA